MIFLSKVVFFHLSQNICKRMRREGLKALYENNVAFALLVRCLAVVAFVPPNQVLETYEALEHQMPDEMLPLLDYFKRTYIGRRIGNQRRAPMFSIEFWNVHNRVINYVPRTNNRLEGHHNLINSTLGFSHPTIWKFIGGLKKLQNGNKTKIACLIARGPTRRKRKYVNLDARLKIITNDFDNRNIMDFLRGT